MSSTGAPIPDEETKIPDKLYFRIGEVAQLAGVEPYVLRFWESEFPQLAPKKSGSGHRLYRRKEVEMVLEVKRLLYEKRFTIEGARRHFEQSKKKGGAAAKSAAAGPRHPGQPSRRCKPCCLALPLRLRDWTQSSRRSLRFWSSSSKARCERYARRVLVAPSRSQAGLLALTLWPVFLGGQMKPPSIPEAWWTGRIEKPLRCAARKYPATLGFDFRYWTGLDFIIDINQFLPLQNGRRLYVLFRVTPAGRPPRFFLQRQYLPAGLQLPPNVKLKDIQITVGGGVHLGVGKYKIEAIAADQDGRACRESWSVDAKAVAEPLRQEPLTVETPSPPKPRTPGEVRQRVAIVANADTFGPRRFGSKLSARDRSALIDSVQSLADTWDTADFSLHVVDIERRKVLLHEPSLQPASFEKADEVLRKVDTMTVDLESLKRGVRGDFVAQFVERSMPEWSRYDAVVFVGPAWRWFDKLPDPARKKLSDLPKIYYLALTPLRFPPANLVKQFVDSQGGRVFNVNWPGDLAKAIKRIRQEKR